MYTSGNAVEINTEADSTDMTECPYDDKPRTGMTKLELRSITSC